jgi:PAS domain-containing protein
VAHVELSLSEPFAPELGAEIEPEAAHEPVSSMEGWTAAVSGALEPCLIINTVSMIVAISAAACVLFGFESQEWAIGRGLLAGIVRLIDFGDGAPLSDPDREKVPSILACSSGQLAHGLLRVQFEDEIRTIDAVAVPLFDGRKVVGSLTFFSPVRR